MPFFVVVVLKHRLHVDCGGDDCKLVEHSVSVYNSCSRCSKVVKETKQKVGEWGGGSGGGGAV